MSARGIIFVVVAVLALMVWFFLRRVEFVFIGAGALLTVIASFALVPRPRRTETVARQLSRGQAAPFVEFTGRVDHPDDGAAWFDTFPDDWFVDRDGDTSRVTAIRRGVYELGPIVRVAVDPFGCVGLRSEHGGTEYFTIWPDVIAEFRIPSSLLHSEAGRSARWGSGENDVGVREYRAGDALRQVHWKHTAHRDELMVRETNAEQRARMRIVLMGAPTTVDLFDEAVTVAASAAVAALTTGIDVELVLDGSTPGRVFGHADSAAVLDVLAAVSLTDVHADGHSIRVDDIVITTGDASVVPGAGATVLAVTGHDSAATTSRSTDGNLLVMAADADGVADVLSGLR